MKMQSKMTRNQTGRIGSRRGFTLVELLVVIAIIGVLAAIALPAISSVRGQFERAANKFEVQSLSDAVEKYRGQYGDYPPDGSSFPIMERHLRKAFPGILQREIDLLRNRQIDPAEALVLFLGGFSSDKQRPISGKGGPILNTGTASAPNYVYNTSRENSMHEFLSGRLLLTDEAVFAGGTNDLFPVYMARNNTIEEGAPYVYFDSRTYLANRGTTAVPIYNCYQPSNITTVTTATSSRAKIGAVRPHLASVSGTTFAFENAKTFQVIGPGTDGLLGGRIVALGAQYFTSKGFSYTFNGTAMDPDSLFRRFELPENNGLVLVPAHDNVCNFTDTNTLGENISN